MEEASAAYPSKIPYNSPPHLSVEALEVYYRIHSNILKTLLACQDRPLDPSLALILAKYLKLAANGLFCKGGKKTSVDQADDTKETAQEKDKGKLKATKADPTKVEPVKSETTKPDPEKHDAEKAPTKSSPDQGLNQFLVILSVWKWQAYGRVIGIQTTVLQSKQGMQDETQDN